MGVVYLAYNRLMGRKEVLKVMGQHIIEPRCDGSLPPRDPRVAQLRHPNIVTAYTAFGDGESLVFAMEYVEGLDLARMVKARGPCPWSTPVNSSTRRRWGWNMRMRTAWFTAISSRAT